MADYSCPFAIGDEVLIDKDASIVARVLFVRFHATGWDAHVGWMHSGSAYESTIDGFRLSHAEAP
jgi:hypothetical protein